MTRRFSAEDPAGPTISNDVKRDLLAFIEGAQACLLHGGDVDKNIITAAIRRNKPKALLAVEPLHSSIAQESHPSNAMDLSCVQRSRLVEYWGEGRQSGARWWRARPSRSAETRSVLYATYAPSIANLISVDQEPSMTNPKIDREAMGRLAKAVAFICGPDHPTTMALKAAAVNGSDQEIKKARALFLRLSPGDRQAALNLLND